MYYFQCHSQLTCLTKLPGVTKGTHAVAVIIAACPSIQTASFTCKEVEMIPHDSDMIPHDSASLVSMKSTSPSVAVHRCSKLTAPEITEHSHVAILTITTIDAVRTTVVTEAFSAIIALLWTGDYSGMEHTHQTLKHLRTPSVTVAGTVN